MPERSRDWRPDWREEASRKLANSKLSAEEREEISRELAGYLEDLCSDGPSRGLDDSAATQIAAAELHEDKYLGAHLFRARKENPMNQLNDRAKRFWRPGMTMLLASAAILAAFQFAGLRPRFTTISIYGGQADPRAIYWPMMIYYPWLAVLPFVGALGAYWSRRSGKGSPVETARFLSAFVFLALLMMVLQFACVLGGMMGEVPLSKTLIPEGTGAIISWVVIPGAALLVGVLPFLRGGTLQPNARIVERVSHHA